MLSSRPPARDPGLAVALEERYRVLVVRPELSLGRALELCMLAESMASLAIRSEIDPTPSEDRLELRQPLLTGALAACAAAVASNPDISDCLLGRVELAWGKSRLVVQHTRRYLDPDDWLRAFGLVATVGDPAGLAALEAALHHLEVPPVLKGRLGEAREFYVSAFSALLHTVSQRFDEARVHALRATELSEVVVSGLTGEHVEARIVRVVMPAVALVAAAEADRAARLRDAVTAHLRYHADYSRPEDPRAEVAWQLVALVHAFGVAAPWPKGVAWPAAPVVASGCVVTYRVPELRARSLGEARVRALSTSASSEITKEERDGQRLYIDVAAGLLGYRFSFMLPESAPDPSDDLGTGHSLLLDAAELSEFARRALDPTKRVDLGLARRAAREAIKWVKMDKEIYRDRMTSALGRRTMDEQPDTLTPAALEQLSADLDSASQV